MNQKCTFCGQAESECGCVISNVEINGKPIDCRLSELPESDRKAIESIVHSYVGSPPNGDGTYTHTFNGELEEPKIGIRFDDGMQSVELTALTEDGKEIIRQMKKEAAE